VGLSKGARRPEDRPMYSMVLYANLPRTKGSCHESRLDPERVGNEGKIISVGSRENSGD
jgi:hypothetical protein